MSEGIRLRYRKGDVLAEVFAGAGPAPYYVRRTDLATGDTAVVVRGITEGELPLRLSELRNAGFRWIDADPAEAAA